MQLPNFDRETVPEIWAPFGSLNSTNANLLPNFFYGNGWLDLHRERRDYRVGYLLPGVGLRDRDPDFQALALVRGRNDRRKIDLIRDRVRARRA